MAVVLDTVDRELKVIQGEGSKSVAEIKEMTKAQELRIKSESEAKAAEIRAITKVTTDKSLAQGKAEA